MTVDAKRLDLRSLLADEDDDDAATEGVAAKTTDESGAPNTQFDFEGSAGTLLLLHDVETERFAARGSWNGERWDRLSIHGSFDDATRIAFDFDRSDATGGVSFVANDLGRVWRALATKSEIEGGALRLTGAATPGGEGVAGHGELRSFTVTEMPVFASILRLGTLDSLVGMFESKGLEFELAQADLAFDGRRLSVANGRAVGGGIALTGEGSFDLVGGTLDFAGTVAHMGRFARMVAHIPLINTLVLGRDRAGIMATRFRLTGALADPEIQVEPLSTLTPGFLRDVFGAGRRSLSPKASAGSVLLLGDVETHRRSTARSTTPRGSLSTTIAAPPPAKSSSRPAISGGTTTAPEIKVEPLSTFTPGFLRDVFGGRSNRRGSTKSEPEGP